MWIGKKEYMRLNEKIDDLSAQYDQCQRELERVKMQISGVDVSDKMSFPYRPSIWQMFTIILDHLGIELQHQKAEFIIVKKGENK